MDRESVALNSDLPIPPLLRYAVADELPITLLPKIGDTVCKGQQLYPPYADQPALHSASSGTVLMVQRTHSRTRRHIEIQTDGLDRSVAATAIGNKVWQLNRSQIADHFAQHGLRGHGGGAFPVATKLRALQKKPAHQLLINAIECDSSISCDKALIARHSKQLIRGIEIAMYACGSKHCTVAVNAAQQQSMRYLQQAIVHAGAHQIKIVSIESSPTAGFERYAFNATTGTTLDATTRPTSEQFISFNIASIFAMQQSIDAARPLISRICSVTDTTGNKQEMELLFGTPINFVFNFLYHPTVQPTPLHIRIGGVQAGHTVRLHDQSVDVSCNSIIANRTQPLTPLPCIRCGLCAEICPENLLPQQLLHYTVNKHREMMLRHALPNCIECGCCDQVCPASIELTQVFHQGKQHLIQQNRALAAANAAKRRYSQRESRLQRKREQSARLLAEKQARLTAANPCQEDPRKAVLQAALARAKNKASRS